MRKRLLAKAHQLATDDVNIHEKLEDCQLRRYRQKIAKTHEPEMRRRLERRYFEKSSRSTGIGSSGIRTISCFDTSWVTAT